ncbi:His-Xaa-Ser repeat protein HxsA [Pantoea vagans]|uniref:His-Xaa-Ser repeat protein HxsA n=1 Tax=Pantoea vagans TaxID=470934 RepID=UPI0035132DBE
MKKFNFAALLPGFLALNNSVWASDSSTGASDLPGMTLNEHDLVIAPLNTEVPFYIAGHRSHSSHHSHSSHRSSSGGGYYGGSTPYYPKTYSSPSTSDSSSSRTRSSSSSSVRSLRSNDADSSTTSSAGTTGVNRGSSGLTSDTEKRKRLIMRVQFALLDKGFYNGNIDGSMGPATRTAIKNYRVTNGLPTPVRETLDTQLLNSLNVLAR